jgi:hypothetical protein
VTLEPVVRSGALPGGSDEVERRIPSRHSNGRSPLSLHEQLFDVKGSVEQLFHHLGGRECYRAKHLFVANG